MKIKLLSVIILLLTILSLQKTTAQHTAQLYGLTQKGGTGNVGTIFHYTPEDHTFHHDFSFDEVVHGKVSKSDVTDGGNGKVYGTTTLGGANNAGVIYEWDLTTNTYTEPYSFETANGTDARGALVLHNGKFYGMTHLGGSGNGGVIYEWDPVTNVYTKKIDFDGSNGFNPIGTLTLYNGLFYGVTTAGGNANSGVLFTWDPATNTFTKKHDFTTTNGSVPIAKLEAYNSKLYGMTSAGGTSGKGVIYEWNPATDTFTKKKDFTGADGENPNGHLTLYNNKFYGVTTLGGSNAGGVIFEWNPATNAYLKKKDLGGAYSGTNYRTTKPLGSLTLKDNIFYLITSAASDGNGVCKGSIFSWDPATNNTTEEAANYPVCAPGVEVIVTEVAMPYATMIVIGDKLYGTSSAYGQGNSGVLFEFNTTTHTHTRSVHFGATNGSLPRGSLTQVGSKLYGMTFTGDYDHHGNIFEWDMTTQQFAVKVRFNASTGWYGGIGLTPNGTKLYGKTAYAPINSQQFYSGTGIFEWDAATNIFEPKVSGSFNDGMLVNNGQSADMYTLGWGANSQRGAIHKYTAGEQTSTEIQILNNDGSQGSIETYQGEPAANSLAYYNGKYYGITSSNGNYLFKGTIFEWDPATNAVTLKHIFTDAEGTYPTGALTLANGKFYGLTSKGGETGFGSLFEWDPATNTFDVKIMMGALSAGTSNIWGYNIVPQGTLTLYDNKLYGLCYGQARGPVMGSIFEYDIATASITDVIFFNGINGPVLGANPKFTQLTLVIPNQEPVVSNVPQAVTSCSNTADNFDFEITDADNDVLQFTVTSSTPTLLPVANIAITGNNGNYTLNYTPLHAQTGVTNLTVTANDGYGGTVTFTMTLTITGKPSSLVVANNAVLVAQQPNAQYQWFDCGTGLSISGATQQVFIAQAIGSYAVNITLNDCEVISDCSPVQSLDIKGYDANSAFLFVNNETNMLEIVTSNTVKQIAVFNALGQLVVRNYGNAKISLESVKTGVYFAIVQTEGGITREKFIKR
ncbi:choice-of-anchor tandem repeat GloVer-containing protein [Flavobacterium psychrotrophum]|uniref:choice-of-anchor tandem repeat GloVer-containing protein n=1 Tax=Flavobacterium psychrotrophum TaxID=2294119 RepID=UPI000E30F47B|nr:choice-of-anchor tandem repeat GloVer-containing protein [Flavobacterium psychrotrophum]